MVVLARALLFLAFHAHEVAGADMLAGFTGDLAIACQANVSSSQMTGLIRRDIR
jgi:hypothetical protein